MAIGIELDPDELILTKGRDFKWAFQNLNESDAPENFPAGDLYFELFTGGEHNCIQRVSQKRASGGHYNLLVGGVPSGDIDYYDVTSAPQNLSGDITDALEAIPGLAGNVQVTNVALNPEWRIALTLNAGVNEVQRIYFNDKTTGGNFKLTHANHTTGLIDLDLDNPSGTAAAMQTALRGLSSIGAGNCTVTAGDTREFYVEFIGSKAAMDVDQVGVLGHGLGWGLDSMSIATWLAQGKVETLTKGTSKLGEKIVNTLNEAINAYFDMFEGLLGCDISFTLTDEKNVVFISTARKSYTENDLLTFTVDVTSNALKGFFNGIASFLGVFNTINVDFRWNHTYEIEFINAKGNQKIPLITSDITYLTSADDDHEVTVTMVETGREPTTKWPFTISGSTASIKVESEEVNKIPQRTRWHLVFLPSGEAVGGDPVARGRATVQE